MIDFTYADFNMWKISRASAVDSWSTEHRYKIYGLKQEDNAPIKVEFNQKHLDKIPKLNKFFRKQGIDIEWKKYDTTKTIEIGLRKDLRQQPILSAAIIDTIIYTFENKFNLKNSKIIGIPKFH